MNDNKWFANLKLVSVAPLYSGNVGSIARLSTNFDVPQVVLVAPQCDPQNNEAQKFACKVSQNTLKNMQLVQHLSEAISDCNNVVGFTRRDGKRRANYIEIDNIVDIAKHGSTALVFGCEDNGLSGDDLLQCTHLCAIPTSEQNPSLNLSHAIAVVLSRLFALNNKTDMNSSDNNITDALVTAGEFDLIMKEFSKLLAKVGLNKAGNPGRMMRYIIKFFQRARLTSKEACVFRGILSQVQKYKE